MIQALLLSFQSLSDRRTIKKLPRLLLGFVGTVGMLIPFLNLLVPVLATAMAVHVVHSESRAT
jgi:uncharacterized protein involved in cysteine biosynthesis